MKPPNNIKLINQKQQQHQQQQQQPTLPFTTSLSNSILRLTQPHQHNSNLIKSSFRYLSLVLIREVAILEDLFIQSPIYRLIRYLTPSILLPRSSTYPFLLTLTVGLIQLKKTWNHQPNLLVNLLISLGPIIHTLRTLNASDIQYHSSSHLEAHHHQLRRWSIYWLIYCTLINLESLNVRVKDPFTPLRSRPTIYPPSLPQTNHENHQGSLHILRLKISKLFKSLSTRYPSSSYLLDQLIPKSIIPIASKGIQPHRPPRIAPESFDIPVGPTVDADGIMRRIPLHQYMFGRDKRVYNLIKVIFLRWCSREDSQVLEVIWSSFLCPIASLLRRVDGSRGEGRRSRGRGKVVKVTVSMEDEDEVEEDGWSMEEDDVWKEGNVGRYNVGTPIRRIQSDPGRRTPMTPSEPKPNPIPILHHHNHNHNRGNTSSPPISSRRSTNLSSSTPLDIPEILHSPIDSIKLSHPHPHPHPHHPHHTHPLLEFKTPENAWDSLSFIG